MDREAWVLQFMGLQRVRHDWATELNFLCCRCMDVRVGPERKLSTKELMLLNCGVGEDSWVPWTANGYNQSILKEISSEYFVAGLMLKLKLQYFCHQTHLKRPWCWERLKMGGEGDDRGWDGWMASLTQWTWVWTSSGYWRWTEKPGMLQSMGSQRVKQDWVTKLNCTAHP